MASNVGQCWGTGDWYTCRYCKKNFPSKRECLSHRRREHHKENPGKFRVKSPTPIVIDDEEGTRKSVREKVVQAEKVSAKKDEEQREILRSSRYKNSASDSIFSSYKSTNRESENTECQGQSSRSLPVQSSQPTSTPAHGNPLLTSSLVVVKREIEIERREGVDDELLTFPLDPACSTKKNGQSKRLKKYIKKRPRSTFVPGHIRVHEMEEGKILYECTVCKSTFQTRTGVRYHEFCLNPDQRPFTCGECGRKFSFHSQLDYHLLVHTGERPFKCPESGCEAAFRAKSKLKRHMLIHTGEPNFVCKDCDMRFPCMTNLKNHVITHAGEKTWSCDTCGECFGLKGSRDRHAKTHQPHHLDDHACNVCERSFASRKSLVHHTLIHTGERPYSCPECPAAFRRRDNMITHLKHVHIETPLKLQGKAHVETSKTTVN